MSRRLALENNRLYEYDYRLEGFIFRQWRDHMITNPDGLIYPQGGSRHYYRTGDFIFTQSYSREEAAQHFQEFADRVNSEYSWGSFIIYLLGLSEINITKEIVEINGRAEHFQVVMRSYMVISDEEKLQLHYRGGRDQEVMRSDVLNQKWAILGGVHSMRAIEPAAIAMLHVISLPFGGAARAGAMRIMGSLMQRYGRRILMRLFTAEGKRRVLAIVSSKVAQKTALFFAKVARDTVQNIIQEYHTQLNANNLRGSVDTRLIESMNLRHIVAHAFRDAVADNITGAITGAIGSLVPDEAAEGLFDSRMAQNITVYVTRELLAEMATPVTIIIKSSIASVEFGSDSTYSQRLGDKVEEEFLSHYRGRLVDLVKSPVESILSDPNLIL